MLNPFFLFSIADFELIDTLWNVNSNINVFGMLPANRINRYIMECKLISDAAPDNRLSLELIDTLWNVNDSKWFLL